MCPNCLWQVDARPNSPQLHDLHQLAEPALLSSQFEYAQAFSEWGQVEPVSQAASTLPAASPVVEAFAAAVAVVKAAA